MTQPNSNGEESKVVENAEAVEAVGTSEISEISDIDVDSGEGIGTLLDDTSETSKEDVPSEAEGIRATIRGFLQTIEATAIDEIAEPQVVLSNPRAILQQEVTLRSIAVLLEAEYIPKDHYLDDGYLEEYLNQLSRLPLNAETWIKIVFSDFVQVLDPEGLMVKITYTDLGMSTKELTLSTDYSEEDNSEELRKALENQEAILSNNEEKINPDDLEIAVPSN